MTTIKNLTIIGIVVGATVGIQVVTGVYNVANRLTQRHY